MNWRFTKRLVAAGACLALALAGAWKATGQDATSAAPTTGPASRPQSQPAEEDAQLARVIESMEEAGAGMRDIQADVSVARLNRRFERTTTRTGRLYYRKAAEGFGQFHLAYETPWERHLYVDDEYAVEYIPSNRIASRVRMQTQGQQADVGLDITRSVVELRKRYRVALAGVEKAEDGETDLYVLDFTPRDPSIETEYLRMRWWVNGERWIPVKVHAVEHGGKVEWTFLFSKIEINKGIRERLLEFRPPRNVKIDDVENIEF